MEDGFIHETKAEARKRHREELLKRDIPIKIGCRKPTSAKANNRRKYPPQGTCMVCGERRDRCKCDDRSGFVKARLWSEPQRITCEKPKAEALSS